MGWLPLLSCRKELTASGTGLHASNSSSLSWNKSRHCVTYYCLRYKKLLLKPDCARICREMDIIFYCSPIVVSTSFYTTVPPAVQEGIHQAFSFHCRSIDVDFDANFYCCCHFVLSLVVAVGCWSFFNVCY